MIDALGIIETVGFTPAVQAADAAVKSANVKLGKWIKVGGGRVAAFEIMGMSLRVRELIMTGETEDKTFYDIIADAKALGWQTFDQHILELYEGGLITEETAVSYCTRKTVVNRGLDMLKSARGEATTSITGLAMDVKQEENRRSGF